MWPFRSKKKNKSKIKILIDILYPIFVFIILVTGEISKHPILIIYIFGCIILLASLYFGLSLLIKRKKGEYKEKPVSLPKEYLKKYPIIIQYTPPKGINPAEAGLLYNCRVDVTDLTSLIYQRVMDGILSIKNISGKDSNHIEKIELTKLRDIPSDHPFFEREIFNSIFFAGDQKTITYSTQLKHDLILEDLEIHGIKEGRIYKSETAKKRETPFYILVGILVLSSIITYIISGVKDEFTCFNVSLLLLIVCVGMGGYMFGGKPFKLTEKGAELASHVIGYRNFIKSCDENKIKLFLKEDPMFVDKVLPYATAFGIETEFIKKITPIKEDLYGTSFRLPNANNESYGSQKENEGLSSLITYLLED